MLEPDKKRTAKVDQYQDRVLGLLQRNSSLKMPIKSYKIQMVFNISDIVVRQIIGKLRDQGYPIGSGKNGFWYAQDANELQSTIDELTDRMAVMSRRKQMLLKAQKKLLVEADGQMKIYWRENV